MSAFKIAIIGAGPGGCMLARLLHQRNIEANIFEGDASFNIRSQGGTLDLHADSGLSAIQEAGLYDEFLKFARFDGEAIILCDKKLTKYISVGGTKSKSISSGSRPEIDRVELRRLLVKAIPEGTIRFGHRLQAVDEDGTLHFEHGGVERGYDLVIGADGAWSKVRSLLSDQKPIYSGVAGYSFSIPNAEERVPKLYKLVNRGSLFACSDGKSIVAQQLGDGSINVQVWSVRSEDWIKESKYDVRDVASVQQAFREAYSDWAPDLLNFTQSAADDLTPRSLYMLPVDFRWTNRAGVTLLGDAAHLMTPFGGAGVNLALEDAMKLAQAVGDAAQGNGGKEALRVKVKEYEEDMFKRVQPDADVTYRAMRDILFTEGAPRTIIEQYVLRVVGLHMHPVPYYALAAFIYTFYFFFKLLY